MLLLWSLAEIRAQKYCFDRNLRTQTLQYDYFTYNRIKKQVIFKISIYTFG